MTLAQQSLYGTHHLSTIVSVLHNILLLGLLSESSSSNSAAGLAPARSGYILRRATSPAVLHIRDALELWHTILRYQTQARMSRNLLQWSKWPPKDPKADTRPAALLAVQKDNCTMPLLMS